jgi:hypothetical protein
MGELNSEATKVFMYGSNMCHTRLKQRAPRWDGSFQVAHLPDHELKFNKRLDAGGWAANVMRSPARRVWGVVVELERHDLAEIDRREGYKSGNGGHGEHDHYRRTVMKVSSGNGRDLVTVEIYVAQAWMLAAEDELCVPSKSYLRFVLDGANECGLPKDYLRAIRRLGEGP